MNRVEPAKYHHGNLRPTLLRAALEVLSEEGIEGLSLRAIARKVGVTTAAPYHHFKDRQSLLVALALDGYALLLERLAAAAAGTLPTEKAAALACSYMRFAREQPAHYALMFSSEVATVNDEEIRHLGEQCLAVVRQWITTETSLSEDRVRELSFSMWSLLHGIIALNTNNILYDLSAIEQERIAIGAVIAMTYGFIHNQVSSQNLDISSK